MTEIEWWEYDDADEFAAACRWALALDGPSVIEAFIDVGPYSKTVFD